MFYAGMGLVPKHLKLLSIEKLNSPLQRQNPSIWSIFDSFVSCPATSIGCSPFELNDQRLNQHRTLSLQELPSLKCTSPEVLQPHVPQASRRRNRWRVIPSLAGLRCSLWDTPLQQLWQAALEAQSRGVSKSAKPPQSCWQVHVIWLRGTVCFNGWGDDYHCIGAVFLSSYREIASGEVNNSHFPRSNTQ